MPIVRVNFNTYEEGEEYRNSLTQEADRNFKVFLTLLSSYWQSTIDGPNYTREIKAISIALAKIRLALDKVRTDTYYKSVRSDFLYQTLTSVLFPQIQGAPDPEFADLDFRDFLQKVVTIYFAGSIPASMKAAVELFTDDAQVIVTENFLEARNPASGFDISDEFGFNVDVILPSPGSIDLFLADKNIRLLLDIIRPAHTLFRLRYILKDTYLGQLANGKKNKITDEFVADISNYGYEDFRRFVEGIDGIDPLGTKKAVSVVGEDHSMDF
jgi:hypothetical protein